MKKIIALYLTILCCPFSMLGQKGVQGSIAGSIIERLWRSVKYDYVYIKVPADGLELYQGLKEYFDYYNNHLCHQGIEHQIPANKYYQAA